MRTLITLIEVLASIVAWSLFGLLLASGAQYAWNSFVPNIGGPHIDVFSAFIGYLVLIAIWLLFVSPIRAEKKAKDIED